MSVKFGSLSGGSLSVVGGCRGAYAAAASSAPGASPLKPYQHYQRQHHQAPLSQNHLIAGGRPSSSSATFTGGAARPAVFPGAATQPGVRPNLIAARYSDRDDFELTAHGYGKSSVKLLHLRRSPDDISLHSISECEVDVYLRLASQQDYLVGDNRDVIATDSQKNTVYLLAKRHGVGSPEEFGLLLCSHFLREYGHVEEVSVAVEEYPWRRHEVAGKPHKHAFVYEPTATRYCQVAQVRNEPPKVRGGLKNFRILKTTQSSFTDFVRDDYRTLPDADDRIFSTIVTASWEFATIANVDFDRVWHTVKDCIMENFAGPPDTGIYSPSVQNTLYLAEKSVLSKVKEIYSIEMRMPNKHYFDIDFSKFPKLVKDQNKEVFLPVDKPSGVIYAQLNRRNFSSKL